jgi:hypothetical protein
MYKQFLSVREAVEYFDHQVEDHFKSEPTLPDTIEFFEKLGSDFNKEGWSILAKACSGAANIYKSGDTKKNQKEFEQGLKKSIQQINSQVLAHKIFVDKLFQQAGSDLERQDYEAAYVLYTKIAEITPDYPDIWTKWFEAVEKWLNSEYCQ